MKALAHQPALRKLRPNRDPKHKIICDWMERRLGGRSKGGGHRENIPTHEGAKLGNHSRKTELEYQVRNRARVTLAIKKEERLVRQYCKWLASRGHDTKVMTDNLLRCDIYEMDRKNLIEAKASTKREYIRMAVGQLFDYAYIGRTIYRKLHTAILLPTRPDLESLEWLPRQISIVWKEGKDFVDNAGDAFT